MLNDAVTAFLDALQHPLRREIDTLRTIVMAANSRLKENIKWNGPNYSIDGKDRITMKIHPPKNIQLIFHRGAKVKAPPSKQLIEDSSGLLQWKANDRAVATFGNILAINQNRANLRSLIAAWLLAAQ